MYFDIDQDGQVQAIQVDLADKELVTRALCELVDKNYEESGLNPYGVGFVCNDLFTDKDDFYQFVYELFEWYDLVEDRPILDDELYDKEFEIWYRRNSNDGLNDLDDFIDLIFDELSARYSN